MKTVKPISAHSTENTVTFAFSAFFVTLCVISLAGMPKPALLASKIKNNIQVSKQEIVKKAPLAIHNDKKLPPQTK